MKKQIRQQHGTVKIIIQLIKVKGEDTVFIKQILKHDWQNQNIIRCARKKALSQGPPAPKKRKKENSKIQKISQVWWCAPVVPASWEAQAGESLEPGRWRVQSETPFSK